MGNVRALVMSLTLGASVLVAPVPAPAFVLDWDTISWPAGSLSNEYNVDGVAGNDIRLFFTGNTNASYWAPNTSVTPNIVRPVDGTNTATASTGGLNPVQQSLEISLDWPSDTNTVTLNVQFIGAYSSGVMNVAFTLFDIDSGTDASPRNWVDRITNVVGIATNGTRVAPWITNENAAPSFTITGNGTTNAFITAISGTGVANTTNIGNARISFSGISNVITGFSFTYANNPADTTDNPTQQHINLHDISFFAVPEPGTLAALALAGGLLFALRRRMR